MTSCQIYTKYVYIIPRQRPVQYRSTLPLVIDHTHQAPVTPFSVGPLVVVGQVAPVAKSLNKLDSNLV